MNQLFDIASQEYHDLSNVSRFYAVKSMFEQGIQVLRIEASWACTKNKRTDFYNTISDKFCQISMGHVIVRNDNTFYDINFSNDLSIKVIAYGIAEEIEAVFAKLNTKFTRIDDKQPVIYWHYLNENGLSYKDIKLTVPKTYSSFYPWLGQSLEDFFDEYLASESNVLIFIGPPGTGKTSLLKYMLGHKPDTSAYLTYEEGVMQKDQFFADFIESNSQFLIAEDADTYLTARSDGNNLMHKFLNISDGLVSTMNKKIVFTTNLPNLHNVDEALLRKGRCFRVLTFRPLNRQEAHSACVDIGMDLPEGEEFLLTDLFNRKSVMGDTLQPKFGFNV